MLVVVLTFESKVTAVQAAMDSMLQIHRYALTYILWIVVGFRKRGVNILPPKIVNKIPPNDTLSLHL
jgi:hypothetical protein